ncbi:hypothetical protein N656DRAFT_401477 [Canariomyces notabilis]|uniref:Uncharacterized protein n=1 Tax=Canariomyces notabilis TaxID=2074819 RepID=A0AAN6TK46_9PEZI|nr:hypothetical protein N656DRAFT_401477 [Canariomyces arenarius]
MLGALSIRIHCELGSELPSGCLAGDCICVSASLYCTVLRRAVKALACCLSSRSAPISGPYCRACARLVAALLSWLLYWSAYIRGVNVQYRDLHRIPRHACMPCFLRWPFSRIL